MNWPHFRMPSQNLSAHQDDRERADLPALDERGGLEQFVQRAQAAGHDDERAGVLHEADLAREEVAELDAADPRTDSRICSCGRMMFSP